MACKISNGCCKVLLESLGYWVLKCSNGFFTIRYTQSFRAELSGFQRYRIIRIFSGIIRISEITNYSNFFRIEYNSNSITRLMYGSNDCYPRIFLKPGPSLAWVPRVPRNPSNLRKAPGNPSIQGSRCRIPDPKWAGTRPLRFLTKALWYVCKAWF